MPHVDEIEDLRRLNDLLNAEIVDKISEWVEASRRLADINRAQGGSPEALREELLANMRGAASERGLDPEGLERIFAAMMEIPGGPEVSSR